MGLEVSKPPKKIREAIIRADNTSYLAEEDGFVCAYVTTPNQAVKGFTDDFTPPTTLLLISNSGMIELTDEGGCLTMPVKKGNYWKVTGANVVRWIPWK